MVFGARSEGGVSRISGLGCTTATFAYLSHYTVVITFESDLTLRTREKGGDVSAPPKNRGGM